MQYIIKSLKTLDVLKLSSSLNNMIINEQTEFYMDLDWATPFGMLFTAISIKQLRSKYPNIDFHMSLNFYKNAVSYAAHMRFFQSISSSITVGNAPGEAPGNDNYIPIKMLDLAQIYRNHIDINSSVEIGEAIEKESIKLAKVLSRNNEQVEKLLTFLIREILRNIPEHADCETAWICGQYWKNQTAEIAIVDEGIGIKDSLQKNLVHSQYIKTDEDALKYAVYAGISESFQPTKRNKSNDPWATSGFGLYMVSEICKKLDGSFCIASGGRYLLVNQQNEIQTGETQFRGTAIKISISTLKLSNSQEIINDIAKQGEEQAKKIRHAFKKASVPSKGFMENI